MSKSTRQKNTPRKSKKKEKRLRKNEEGLMTWIPAYRICCGCNIHIHTDYTNPVEEKGWRVHALKRRAPLSASATPSRREHPDPCLDRLVLFF